MNDKSRGIVLQSIKYNDTSLIAKIFTEEYGLQSYFIKGSYNKKSKFRPAFFQPMSIIDFVVAKNNTKKLNYILEIGVGYVYQNIPVNIRKSTIVMYMSELLSKTLAEHDKNIELFLFLHKSLLWLDLSSEKFADFPLYFTIELTRFLGFYPKSNTMGNPFHFDLMEGVYRNDIPNHPYYLTKESSKMLDDFCKFKLEELSTLKYANRQRRILLDELITYYKLHVPGFKGIQSHEVLRDVLE